MKLRRLFGRRRRLGDFLDDFAKRRLADILKEIGRPEAVAITRFASGRNTLVRRLELADGNSLVLRAYFVDPEKRKAFSHCYLNRRLGERGFCVPRIHFTGEMAFARGKANVEVIIEDYVESEPIGDAMSEDRHLRARLAATLRQLHADRSPKPGRTWLGRQFADPVVEAEAKAPVLFERIARQLGRSVSSEAERCLEWLRQARERRAVPDSYELIHGDFTRENILLRPDGAIALVDLGTMEYGCFETDLVCAADGFFNRSWWDGFCADYFQDDSVRRERFQHNAALFFAGQRHPGTARLFRRSHLRTRGQGGRLPHRLDGPMRHGPVGKRQLGGRGKSLTSARWRWQLVAVNQDGGM